MDVTLTKDQIGIRLSSTPEALFLAAGVLAFLGLIVKLSQPGQRR